MTVRSLSTAVEARIDRAARRLLDAGHQPHRPVRLFVTEFLVFGAKQAWACAFGALLLGSMAVASLTVPGAFRNDALTVVAVLLQLGMLVFGLETVRELRVVLLFHVVGTAMEVFKTHMGSWSYEPGGLFVIAGVPLFSGFMYGAVGSYMVRVHRLFDLRFDRYPRQWLLAVVAAGVYLNFFGHHFLPDARWVLLALVVLLFARTTMHVRIHRSTMRMPVLVAMGLVAVFIWFAENVATWAGAWSYPAQLAVWHPVAPTKIVAWFLLMTISVALVTWLYPAVPSGSALPSGSARWTADSRRLRGARAAGAHRLPSSGPPGPRPLAANPQPSATERT
ncbi:uncharacterized membrane protein YoaT (DUF817 family) [Curtobacterium sp. PhB25]|uniref:DUF817 domain-containing protein n=1 Tax=unclassified Curtobacterium TaxID=257496 RepID=UPI0010624116|nr:MULTISPECIES: DUF817 domain-containing protein [unclassified Curtobacterium]TDW49358.1 uncharacterized membrane protein YoaT (DUF817 family) [Curtobacterium sp. PhB42]TDW56605.1 uncharacterized membrane protein YoaT (DUF817 family) [Curtobacterium sp. PhB190]TDW72555.1 uncharacterized membrane protein YoaT (DUF817 family) [Curtobacterium sp. PhB25]